MTELHIAIVDDDPSVRDSLAIFLSGKTRTVSAHADGESFLESVSQRAPDIAFIDLKMPGLSGLEVLRRLAGPPCPGVMISAHGDISAAVQASKLGAMDFIEKPFAPEIVEEILADLQRPPQQAGADAACGAALSALTEREREIALALNEGLTNKEVARQLEISPRTVEVHRAHIFQKVGVRNLAGLVRVLSRVT